MRLERVVEKDGERYLRAATPISVVHKNCLICHRRYADAKEGEPIDSLSYTLKIE